jgi:hypothetical protein
MKPAKDDTEFQWPLLFFITALCFLVFSLLTRLLDGQTAHVSLFFKIAIAAGILTVISFLGIYLGSRTDDGTA